MTRRAVSRACEHRSAKLLYFIGTGMITRECLSCGYLLSLGESNDAPDEVKVEMAAALTVAEWRDQSYFPGVDRFEYCPNTKTDELCDMCHGLYLAHAIIEHDHDRITEHGND
jgi:hypothetical protein